MAGPTTLAATGRLAREASPVPFLYRVLRGPLRQALTRWFDLRVDGLEHLPSSGPYLVAANHHNYLDGVVLGVTVPDPISFLVMPRVWRATPLHPMFHRNIRSIPIDLDRADVSALRRALASLQEGRVVGIFPEGPFSVRGRLELAAHRRQPLHDRVALGGGQQPGSSERLGPRDAPGDVVRPEPSVEGQRAREALGGRIGALGEPSAPELLRFRRAAPRSRTLAGSRLHGRSAAMSSMIRRVTRMRALRPPCGPSPEKQRAGPNLTPSGTRRGM